MGRGKFFTLFNFNRNKNNFLRFKFLGLERSGSELTKFLKPDPNYFDSDPQHCFCFVYIF